MAAARRGRAVQIVSRGRAGRSREGPGARGDPRREEVRVFLDRATEQRAAVPGGVLHRVPRVLRLRRAAGGYSPLVCAVATSVQSGCCSGPHLLRVGLHRPRPDVRGNAASVGGRAADARPRSTGRARDPGALARSGGGLIAHSIRGAESWIWIAVALATAIILPP